MIGKIILGIWVLSEVVLHIRFWGQEQPIKYVGWKTVFADLFDLILIGTSVIWW